MQKTTKPRLRLLDGVLLAAVLAAAAFFAWRHLGTDGGAEASTDASPTPEGMQIGVAYRPTFDPVEPLAEPEATGRIRFDVGEGRELRGIVSAAVLKHGPGGLETQSAVEVHPAQWHGELRLEGWLATTDAVGPHALRYVLALKAGEVTNYHAGWIRFEVEAMHQGGVVVQVPEGRPRTIRVTTANGTNLPGVLIGVQPTAVASLPFGVYAKTDASGVARIVGLEDDTSWTASLTDGAGPFRGLLREELPKDGGELTMRVPVGGRWTFAKFPVCAVHPGLSAKLVALRVGEGRERPKIIPVSRLLLPGRPDPESVWMMAPEGETLPPKLELGFEGCEPVEVAANGPVGFLRPGGPSEPASPPATKAEPTPGE